MRHADLVGDPFQRLGAGGSGQTAPDDRLGRGLAQGLLEYETLTGPEITRVMRGEGPGRDEDDAPSSGTPSVASIPKTRPRRSNDDGGLEPNPSA